MEPVQEAVSLDPHRRYQSMLATVNILNQARKSRRKNLMGTQTIPSISTLSTGTSSSSTAAETPSAAPGDNRSAGHSSTTTRARLHWQAAVGKASSHSTTEEQQGTGGGPPATKKNLENLEKGKLTFGLVATEIATRRRKLRKWRNDRKRALYLKFRRVAWIAILVRRICRMHYIEVSNAADLSFAQASSSRDSIDVMFDVTHFRAKKQKLLSQEAKRILRTSPEKRTSQEIYYVQIAIRQLQAIAGYPVRMLTSLARVSWYEAYGPTRVIVREGHPPRAFYFIYSGSVVVTVLEPGRLTQRTVAILKRGDSFGELAILNHGSRTSTITAREDLQLIVISAEDFMKIFMSGGVKRLTDPDHLAFIRSIEFLKGWPIQLLDLHPKQCVFNFFRRDMVLVRDSKYSDWIYIVKSGSCSVVMRLAQTKTARKSSQNKTKKETKGATVLDKPERQRYITPSRHEERLVKKENSFLRSKVHLLNNSKANLFHRGLDLPLLSQPDPAVQAQADHEESGAAGVSETNDLRRVIAASLAKEIQAGEESVKMRSNTGRTECKDGKSEQECAETLAEGELRGTSFGPRRTFADDLNAHRVNPISDDNPDTPPVFVCVRIIVKGGVFGLAELMFSDQPSVSLVSNGAECVVLSKQFFLEHAPEHLIHQIRLSVTPYGSVDELQVNFEKELSWKQYRDSTLRQTVHKLRTDRAAENKLGHSL